MPPRPTDPDSGVANRETDVTFSVIIPTLNEEKTLADSIRSCWANGASEIIVSDGGSHDQTLRIAESENAKTIVGNKGRGGQLRRGALAATQPVLLFLHADNRLASECGNQIREAFGQKGQRYCFFRQRIENRKSIFRWIEKGNAFRARWQKLPYGDQGISVTRELYDLTDGFQDVPLMEDVQLAIQLAKLARPVQLEGPLHVSDRRWVENGPWRQTFMNWWTLTRFRWGADPAILANAYNRENQDRSKNEGD